MKPTGKKEVIDADLVLLAMGFLKPQQPELPDERCLWQATQPQGQVLWCGALPPDAKRQPTSTNTLKTHNKSQKKSILSCVV